MYICTSRFEIHEEQRAAKEERTQQQLAVDLISDNEEDEGSTTQLQARSQPQATSQAAQGPSVKALSKRRLSSIDNDMRGDEEEDDGQELEDIPLPET
ncbi:hypothetical protein N7492_004234 [Penicillium capsulatum]|uniref:Uncharacterized protein n=1 Tax=Penicillium capsulatum TaxID=69766 RepID=A0A9W9LQJ1_9EURO|nr:hypothetical protein N7492_004234 [Penicillium capsulatum]KAJ6136646.1 hypothetical protein N7512_001806 [Penicillium capsulatum]